MLLQGYVCWLDTTSISIDLSGYLTNPILLLEDLYVLPYGQMSLWGILYTCLTCACCITIIMWSYDFITVYLRSTLPAKRIRAIARVGPHNHDITSIFYGALLGDAHAEYRDTGGGTRISFSQESNHKQYLIWLHNKVAELGYCNNSVPKIQTRLGSNGAIRQVIRFHTYTYSSLNSLHASWYTNGVKHVPANIAQYLTPMALAIWIMDDGGRVGHGLKFCTNSFTFADCTRLVSVMYEKYGVKATVQSAGVPNQHVIYVWVESMPVLREIVRPYMVPSMLYKLGQ